MILSYKEWASLNYRSKKNRIVKKRDQQDVDERYTDYCIKKARKAGTSLNQALFDSVYKHSIEKIFGQYNNTFRNLANSERIMDVHMEKSK